MRSLLTFAALATMLTGVASAQSRAETSSGQPTLSIGGGMIIKPDYSGADTYDSMAIPVISASKELTPGNTVYLRGLQAGLDHEVNSQLTVGALVNYRFERDSSDSEQLTGMADVDGAIELGPKVRYQLTPQIGLEGTALFDISDAHEGFTARAGADYTMPLSEVTMLTFAAGMNYGSEDYTRTYYGVPAANAISGRPAYSPDAGITNLDAGVSLRHALTDNWSLTGRVGADYLMGDAADSPLVEQEFQPTLMLGAAYRF